MRRNARISKEDAERLRAEEAKGSPWAAGEMRCSWVEWCLVVLGFAILLLLILTPFLFFRFGWFVPVANGIGFTVIVAVLAGAVARVARRGRGKGKG